jgi:hypothetical protein
MDTKPLPDDDSASEKALVSSLAQSLDCFAEHDVCLLGKVTLATTRSWRKRGIGPAYVLIGNRYLYPRQALAEFLKRRVRERATPCSAGVL